MEGSLTTNINILSSPTPVVVCQLVCRLAVDILNIIDEDRLGFSKVMAKK